MIRKLFTAIALFCTITLSAQDDFKKINEIKRSEEYLWEQFSDESAETAIEKASEILLKQLQATDPNLKMEDIRPFVHHIIIKRETITRTFVYINPADLTKPSAIVNKQNLASDIVKCKDFSQVYYELMPKAQEEGRIIDFGGMKGVDSIETRYIIIFDKLDAHAPLAVLSPTRNAQGARGNLVSHAEENLSDYRGYPALWFRMKEDGEEQKTTTTTTTKTTETTTTTIETTTTTTE